MTTRKRQFRTSCLKVRTYLQKNMYKRVNGKRVEIYHTEQEYRDIIEHAMEALYDYHIEELERRGEL